MRDESLEAPEPDASDQETDATPEPLDDDDTADELAEELPDVPLETDAADAVEQAREVKLDEDEDYR